MRDVYEVLRSKEMEIVRLRQEIESLRAVIPLLNDAQQQVSGQGERLTGQPGLHGPSTLVPAEDSSEEPSFWSFGRRSEQ